MDFEQLKPYKSYLFCNIKDTEIEKISLDIEAIVKDGRNIRNRQNILQGDLGIAFITYVVKKTPAWYMDTDIEDITNHLVLLISKGTYLAIYSSEASVREKIRKDIINGENEKESSFTYLSLIPQGLLNAVFVKGQTQTLWLSGTHKRTATKVDNKIITGIDLQYALDPLGDQTFFFTAARCKLPKGFDNPVGISPRKSSLWAGMSKNWDDFISRTDLLLTLLEKAKKKSINPLPVLATSINSHDDIKNIGTCYEAAFVPPELLAETDIDQETREMAEKWSTARFEIVTDNAELGFKSELYLSDQEKAIGEFTFIFEDTGKLPRIDWQVEGTKEDDTDEDVYKETLNILKNNKSWLKIWYDSGHVIVAREICLPRFRDLPFEKYKGINLKGYEIGKEKPPYPLEDNIGKKKSLFCYAQKNIKKGWLACDDGSMEIADFIHFDNNGPGIPTLFFIHVKASKKIKPDRSIAVSDYEIVVSQAEKISDI